jgi:hypothetical protein
LSSFKKTVVTFGVVAFGVAAVACTERIYMGEVKADGGAPGFVDPNSRDAAFADGEGPVPACIGTECPAPWATCVSQEKPTYKCGTDTLRDNDHCGACGNACPTYKPIHMSSRCNSGSCELECYTEPELIGALEWRNCNGLVDDGCEIDVLSNTNHCGACGNKCPAGAPCLEGHCGCPPGLTYCGGNCVDTLSDDMHCGGCNTECESPPGACSPLQPNTKYGCFQGQCGRKKCQDEYADCNGDLGQSSCGGDGCEVHGLNTKDNCGDCGIKCTKPYEECVDEGNGWECAVPCERFGKVLCGDECVDLLNDVGACGACSSGCKPSGPNQVGSCKKGVCSYECVPGFADCNGDSTDGCETNLNTHPGNCGACGNSCDTQAGQPCIEGKCLMTDCDGGVTR